MNAMIQTVVQYAGAEHVAHAAAYINYSKHVSLFSLTKSCFVFIISRLIETDKMDFPDTSRFFPGRLFRLKKYGTIFLKKGGVGLIRFDFIQLHLKHMAFRELAFLREKFDHSTALV